MQQSSYQDQNKMIDIKPQQVGALKKVHLISLGCSRNRVDAEVMLGSLLEKGWQHTTDESQADAIIVNTCGFIDAAKEESVDTILSASELKKQNPNLKLFVTGCLTQRYKNQLAKGLPEVDLFLGVDEFANIHEYVEKLSSRSPSEQNQKVYAKRTHYIYNEYLPRINTLNKASAYVKVAEGCQHNCAFCIIPAIRGKLRSRPIASIVAEVKKLVLDGVKEVNLIAQDLAAFGREQGRDDLLPLLKELVAIDDLYLIRLLYMYPENISDDFLEFMASQPKIAKYLDIPIQHASDKILKLMNRDITNEQLKTIINKVRTKVPGITLRTTVMVGFPHEDENDFNMLRDFVIEQKFNHLGCFTYSKESGTQAAKMQQQVEESVKDNRQNQIMSLQTDISAQHLRQLIGKKVSVLIDSVSLDSEFVMQGRLAGQAPEVDGVVYIEGEQPEVGSIVQVLISQVSAYDLVGSIC